MRRLISNKEFIECAVGVIYRQAPNNEPRNINKIIDHIKTYFYQHEENNARGNNKNSLTIIELEEEDTYDLIKDCLFSCEEFKQLNLSQYELNSGISDINDPKRQQIVFVSLYDKIKPEHDFIDLDACIRNITNSIYRLYDEDDLFEKRVFLCEKDENGYLKEIGVEK